MRLRSPSADCPWFFPSRNGTHITRQRFWQIIRAYAVMDGLAVSVHPHMLHHACGFALAERGNDTRLIQDISDTKIFVTPSVIPPPVRRAFDRHGYILPVTP
ncbi:tyrosine-type recombinase/integrase [Escherichia coli]|uniref:tyrosine-type recombinase/integrase n=1 Tax=Escherichia coli TaxID=562 RepID=UPI001FCE4DFA|nr:tyrosine-type recombinase/integrase [Escherichia coli]